MRKVSAERTLSEVLSSGTALISRFLIAPNDKLYVLFSQLVDLGDTTLDCYSNPSPNCCLLAEIDPVGGVPVCIDASLTYIQWNWESRSPASSKRPIQFDDAGAVYYIGADSAGKTVLRRYANGARARCITRVKPAPARPIGSANAVLTAASPASLNLRKIFLAELRTLLDTWDIWSLVGKLGPPNLVAQTVS